MKFWTRQIFWLSMEDIVMQKIYKYAVLWGTIGGVSHTSFSGGGTTTNFSSPTIDYSGHFLDRAAGKEYPVTKKYNNYGSLGYIPFFNSVIKYSR